jgi:hypothetical protein
MSSMCITRNKWFGLVFFTLFRQGHVRFEGPDARSTTEPLDHTYEHIKIPSYYTYISTAAAAAAARSRYYCTHMITVRAEHYYKYTWYLYIIIGTMHPVLHVTRILYYYNLLSFSRIQQTHTR